MGMAWAALAGVLVAGTGCTRQDDRPSGPDMAPEARSYLSGALTLMEKNSLLRHETDWPKTRERAFAQTRSAQKPADTYVAIRSALNSLGDGHSSFFEPEQVEDELEAPVETFAGLRGWSMSGRVGYVVLPGVQGFGAAGGVVSRSEFG
ncbi:hypothetical protein [Streptomyces sp. NBC_00076]|uniref:hypothetical protein n=1 Tax=Streptomyces sp. NBC_00076 TaxID=2975642 RepID=UPI0032447E9F